MQKVKVGNKLRRESRLIFCDLHAFC